MPNQERGRLDNAIDRAVRGMMQVDPRPGLSHRVAARLIDRTRPGRRASLLFPAFTAAALAAGILAAIVLLRAPQPQPVIEQQVAAPQPAPQTAPVPAPPVESAAPPGKPEPSRANARKTPVDPASIFGPRRDRVTAASLPSGLASAPAPVLAEAPQSIPEGLPAFAPIAVSPIQMTPIAIQPLSVSPLPIRR